MQTAHAKVFLARRSYEKVEAAEAAAEAAFVACKQTTIKKDLEKLARKAKEACELAKAASGEMPRIVDLATKMQKEAEERRSAVGKLHEEVKSAAKGSWDASNSAAKQVSAAESLAEQKTSVLAAPLPKLDQPSKPKQDAVRSAEPTLKVAALIKTVPTERTDAYATVLEKTVAKAVADAKKLETVVSTANQLHDGVWDVSKTHCPKVEKSRQKEEKDHDAWKKGALEESFWSSMARIRSSRGSLPPMGLLRLVDGPPPYCTRPDPQLPPSRRRLALAEGGLLVRRRRERA